MPVNYVRNEKSEEILQTLKEEIAKNHGILKRDQVKALGIDYRRVLDFVETGDLVRIKNGYYTDSMDRFNESALIYGLFPDAVLCLASGLYAQGMIKERPFAWQLAVDKNTSKTRFVLDYPKVVPNYTEPEALALGQETIEFEGQNFRVYCKERLVCDCLKYEAKMDREIFKEALLSYINMPDKDIAKLMEYAKARKVVKKVQSVIGVWL